MIRGMEHWWIDDDRVKLVMEHPWNDADGENWV